MKNIWQTYKEFVSRTTVHRSELVSIQWLRGIAVMMVFIYHLEDIIHLIPEFSDFRSFWLMYGYSAPDLFFVISGFIMCFVTFELKFKPMGWLVRRFLRIYPIFFIYAALSIMVWLINPNMTMGSGEQDIGKVLKFLFLLPQENIPLLFVTWTLEHEIVFYGLVFVVATLGGKARSVVVLMAILSVLAILKSYFQDEYPVLDFWDYHILSLFIVQFFIGAFIFEFREFFKKTGVRIPIGLGLVIFFISGLVCEPKPLNQESILKVIMFGASFGLILIGSINLELKKRKEIGDYIEFKRRPFLVQMGDASYSIYLSHPFFLSIVGKLVLSMNLSTIWSLIAVIIGGGLSLLLGYLSYHFLEKPIIHASKSILTWHKQRKEISKTQI